MSDELMELPEGWCHALLSELGELTRGKSKHRPRNDPRLYGDLAPFIQTGEVARSRGRICSFSKMYSEFGVQQSRIFPKGTVCITIAANIADTGILGFDACFPDSIVGLIVEDNLADPYFVEYFIRTIRGDLAQFAPATAQANINLEILNKVVVPLPPLNEQKRIVAQIEALRERSQKAKAALEAIPELCDRFRQSVLAAAFRGDLTADWREQNPDVESPTDLVERIYVERQEQYKKECTQAAEVGKKNPKKPSYFKPRIHSPEYSIEIPESWFWTSFEDISSIKQHAMSSGPFGSALGTKDYRETGIPVIRGQNIQNGKMILENFVYVTEDKALELLRSNAYPGDVVIVAVGSSGQAALVPQELSRAVLSQNCNKFTVDRSFIDPHFIVLLLQNEIAKSQLKEKTTDTVRQFLSLTNLKTTLLPIPPLLEQYEIVRRIDTLFNFASRIEEQYEDVKFNLLKLDQSILAKAFRGELVEQDPNDEPASVLLDRIRAEREAQQPVKKSQRKGTAGRKKQST